MPVISSAEQRTTEFPEMELSVRCFHNKKGICRNTECFAEKCRGIVCEHWVSWDRELKEKVNERIPEGFKINWNEHLDRTHLLLAKFDLQEIEEKYEIQKS